MRFDRAGIAFEYPDNWEVDASDTAALVSVTTPEGGFWTVSAHAAGGDPLRLAEVVARQMKREYAHIDIERAGETVAGRRLEGFDFNFSYLDLTNTAEVRVVGSETAVYLVFCQAEDRDWDRLAPVFAAMKTSLVHSLAAPDPG